MRGHDHTYFDAQVSQNNEIKVYWVWKRHVEERI